MVLGEQPLSHVGAISGGRCCKYDQDTHQRFDVSTDVEAEAHNDAFSRKHILVTVLTQTTHMIMPC